MNKIMELVRRVLVSESNEDLNLIQAEVTRMEAELAGSILERNMLMQSITDPENQPSQHGTVTLEYHEAVSQERDALRAKLAALEAQEPVAEYIRHEGWDGLVKYLVNRGPLLKPGDKLYLAAGAKADQAEQSCAGYGNHAPGDAPCNVCGFRGRKP